MGFIYSVDKLFLNIKQPCEYIKKKARCKSSGQMYLFGSKTLRRFAPAPLEKGATTDQLVMVISVSLSKIWIRSRSNATSM